MDAISEAWSGYAANANDGRLSATNYWDGRCAAMFVPSHIMIKDNYVASLHAWNLDRTITRAGLIHGEILSTALGMQMGYSETR